MKLIFNKRGVNVLSSESQLSVSAGSAVKKTVKEREKTLHIIDIYHF